MAKFSLDIEYDYDFHLLGIASHLPDYRLCWAINLRLGLELVKREEPLKILHKDKLSVISFDVFCGMNEETQAEFNLIDNINNGVHLIPEMKSADYILQVKGVTLADLKEIQQNINHIDQVLTSFVIQVSDLKSKEKLLF